MQHLNIVCVSYVPAVVSQMLTCAQVNDAIDKILRSRQTTCLIVAHRLSTIARAERIVVLEGSCHYSPPPFLVLTRSTRADGHVVESGSYRHLVSLLSRHIFWPA